MLPFTMGLVLYCQFCKWTKVTIAMKLGKTDSHFYTVVSQDEIFMDIYHRIRTTDINSMMYENKQCSCP
jgi:hypothetical protein